MPTTARGIWTPSDTDAVDFTTHLATMAGTIDTAITNGLNTIGAGANAFKGTAAQRTAFLSTAVNGMLWQDTDSIKMIWRKDGAAWVPAVWRWSGTTAQMNAFTQAPNGFEWFNTTDNRDYVRLGGSWVADFAVTNVSLTIGIVQSGENPVRVMDRRDGTSFISGTVRNGNGLTLSASFQTIATIPVPSRPALSAMSTASAGSTTSGAVARVTSAGALQAASSQSVCAFAFTYIR